MLLLTSESSNIWVILIEDIIFVQKTTKREGASTLLLRINERHSELRLRFMPPTSAAPGLDVSITAILGSQWPSLQFPPLYSSYTCYWIEE